MVERPRNGPECIKCGGDLVKPEPGAQWEYEDCGAVVSDDSLRGDYSWR